MDCPAPSPRVPTLNPPINVPIITVARPLVMYKFFVSVNQVESHNKHRQSDLVLEKYWITQCGWLRLCMTAAMVNTINNLCKPLRYGIKRDHH